MLVDELPLTDRFNGAVGTRLGFKRELSNKLTHLVLKFILFLNVCMYVLMCIYLNSGISILLCIWSATEN